VITFLHACMYAWPPIEGCSCMYVCTNTQAYMHACVPGTRDHPLMDVHVFMYVCMHTHTRTHTNTHTYTWNKRPPIDLCMYVCMHTHTHTHTYKHTHTYVPGTRDHPLMDVHVFMYVCMHTHTHTHTHTYKHTHICTWNKRPPIDGCSPSFFTSSQ
jgi:hypothetical protein